MNERDIFIAALQQPSRAQRQKYLDQVCGGDQALRRNVEALLAAHDRAGSFLEKPAIGQIDKPQDKGVQGRDTAQFDPSSTPTVPPRDRSAATQACAICTASSKR